RRRVRDWRALPSPRPWRGIFRRRPQLHRQVCWQIAVALGLVVGCGALRLDWFTALPVLGQSWTWRGEERRPLVPTSRLIGASLMGAHVAQLAADLRRETRAEPLIIAQHYGRASLLAFYAADDSSGDSDPDSARPLVYSSSSFMAG